MSTTDIPATQVAIVTETPSEFLAVLQQNHVALQTVDDKIQTFLPHWREVQKLKAEALTIRVEDAADLAEMAKARRIRLALVKQRTGANKLREEHKATYLSIGRVIDGTAKVIIGTCELLEQGLEAQEKLAERIQAERKAKLQTERVALLAEHDMDGSLLPLSDMTPERFTQMRWGAKLAKDARIAADEAKRVADEKAETDRKAKEAADKAEQDRLKKENDQLKAEADAREATRIANEKAAAEAKKKEADRLAVLRVERLALLESLDYEGGKILFVEAMVDEDFDNLIATAREKKAERIAKAEADKKEKARLAAVRVDRLAVLAHNDFDAALLPVETMLPADFLQLVEKAVQEKVNKAAKAEADRKEAARLKKIADDQAAEIKRQKAEADQAKADAKLIADKAEADRLAKIEADKKAAAAPDREKLLAFSELVADLIVPTLTTTNGILTHADLTVSVAKFATHIRNQADKL